MVQARSMREKSPNHSPATHLAHQHFLEPKSLTGKILRASHCGSIFYPDPSTVGAHKSSRMNILALFERKKITSVFSPSKLGSYLGPVFPLDPHSAFLYDQG